jgi:hypothetical protein
MRTENNTKASSSLASLVFSKSHREASTLIHGTEESFSASGILTGGRRKLFVNSSARRDETSARFSLVPRSGRGSCRDENELAFKFFRLKETKEENLRLGVTSKLRALIQFALAQCHTII